MDAKKHPVRGVSEIPDGTEVEKKQSDGKEALQYRERPKTGDGQKPLLEAEKIDSNGKQQYGQNG